MPYYKFKDNLSVCNDLLLYNNRIVVPKSLRKETLQKRYTLVIRVLRDVGREYRLQCGGLMC